MKILVTGAAGYVGSVVCRFLLANGHHVRAFDSLRFGGESLAGLFVEDHFEFRRGDIRSADDVTSATLGMDGVVHLAAIVGDPACAREKELAKETNHTASLHLYDAARRAGAERFIFASTCSNYGRMNDPEHPVDEDAELRPVSLYAQTKVAVEQFLLGQSVGSGPTTTVLRFATIFGISPRMRFDLTVNEFTRDLLLTGKLTVFGEQFWRPYIHVRDVARAIVDALVANRSTVDRRVFNVGHSDENHTKGMLVERIRTILGTKTEVNRVHRDEDPRDYRVDFSRIRQELGFQPTRTVDDGIREIAGALRGGIFGDPMDPRYRN